MKYIFNHKRIAGCMDCPFVAIHLGPPSSDLVDYGCILYGRYDFDVDYDIEEWYKNCEMIKTGEGEE